MSSDCLSHQVRAVVPLDDYGGHLSFDEPLMSSDCLSHQVRAVEPLAVDRAIQPAHRHQRGWHPATCEVAQRQVRPNARAGARTARGRLNACMREKVVRVIHYLAPIA